MNDQQWNKMMEDISCQKCKLYNLAALEAGYSKGMCEDCFNESYVLVKILEGF